MQVELIQQFNDSPSIYSHFPVPRAGRPAARRRDDALGRRTTSSACARSASSRCSWGSTANGIRFAYLSTDQHPGGMIELIEHGPAIDGFFAMVREAAQGWDGSEPVRRL